MIKTKWTGNITYGNVTYEFRKPSSSESLHQTMFDACNVLSWAGNIRGFGSVIPPLREAEAHNVICLEHNVYRFAQGYS